MLVFNIKNLVAIDLARIDLVRIDLVTLSRGSEWNITGNIGLSGSHFHQDCHGMALITNSS